MTNIAKKNINAFSDFQMSWELRIEYETLYGNNIRNWAMTLTL